MGVRRIETRLFGKIQTEMFHIPDYADNYDPVNLRILRPADSLADRIFTLEVRPHHRIIGDPNERCMVGKVLRTKVSSGAQRNPHGVEVVAHDATRLQTRFIAGSNRRPAFDQKLVVELITTPSEFR